jgi:starch synthase
MKDGVHGLMVDRPDDEQGFASALGRLLDDPETARTMGAAARKHAVDAFAWPLVAQRLESLYLELLERKGVHLLRQAA